MWAGRAARENLPRAQPDRAGALDPRPPRRHLELRGGSRRKGASQGGDELVRQVADEAVREAGALAAVAHGRHTGILPQLHATSAAIEAINGLLQLARRRARGYRRFENFRAIAYWIAGSLKSMAIQTQPTECSGEPILLTFANSRESC